MIGAETLAARTPYSLILVENRLLWVDAVDIVWGTILASNTLFSSCNKEVYDGALAWD